MDPTGRNLKDQDDQKWSAPKFRLIHKYCWGPLQNPPHLSLKQLFHWQTMYMYTYTYCIYFYTYTYINSVFIICRKIVSKYMNKHNAITSYFYWISQTNVDFSKLPTPAKSHHSNSGSNTPPGRLRGVEVTISMTPLELERWQLDGFILQKKIYALTATSRCTCAEASGFICLQRLKARGRCDLFTLNGI